ncbi:hypothetical protein BDW71DRAFT_190644 [Aspergillus fruticulosus]
MEQPVPQLSCALCRDRKLKCDKLDPCTNCTSSGVACVPIYRPRLPRGRHARPNRQKLSSPTTPLPPATRRRGDSGSFTVAPGGTGEDLSSRLDRLESLLQRRDVATGVDTQPSGMQELLQQSTVGNDGKHTTSTATTTQICGAVGQDVYQRIRSLEGLVQEVGKNNNNSGKDSGNRDDRDDNSNTEPRAIPDMAGSQSGAGNFSQELNREIPEVTKGVWPDLMDHEMQGQTQGNAVEPREDFTNDDGSDMASFNVGAIGTLRLLDIDNPFSPASTAFPRDKNAVSKLCQVYLQNVDPIIKILHRPSLSKCMLDGSPYPGASQEDHSDQALESAVCYAAANTMSEAQCQEAFKSSKSSVVTMYRKMCEAAIERTGLLTTRNMTVLQAFTLYLVGRRSEDEGTAVWALVALLVRLTVAMGLNAKPSEETREGESFFQQQMRLRLWLTVCLMDIQTSFAEASEPLISHRDAASTIPHVAHVNDSDFDVDTLHPVASHEDLTDTTFALVTYHVQVTGRLLNFASPESSTIKDDPEARHRLVRHFQQQVFTLLHYCDPESSRYAWFTWHSTQSIVASIRLAELIPFRGGRANSSLVRRPSTRPEGDATLLRRALQNLEKAQLICSDPRGDGFRWYITTPWLALYTAIVECATCTDAALVRRAWPVIEITYHQHVNLAILPRCQLPRVPLAQLMNETRERIAPLLQDGGSGSGTSAGNNQGAFCRTSSSAQTLRPSLTKSVSYGGRSTPIEQSLTSGSLSADSAMDSEAPLQSWNLPSISMDDAPGLGADGILLSSDLYNPLQSDLFEHSWVPADTMSQYAHLPELSDKRPEQVAFLMSTHRRI